MAFFFYLNINVINNNTNICCLKNKWIIYSGFVTLKGLETPY